MRIALLIGLLAASVAGAAQAQYQPYKPPKPYSSDRDPYDLPKAYQTNPYDRDYSKPAPGTSGPGYRNVDGSASSRPNSGSSYGGYGARSSGAADYGVSSSRNQRNPNCSKPGVVC